MVTIYLSECLPTEDEQFLHFSFYAFISVTFVSQQVGVHVVALPSDLAKKKTDSRNANLSSFFIEQDP